MNKRTNSPLNAVIFIIALSVVLTLLFHFSGIDNCAIGNPLPEVDLAMQDAGQHQVVGDADEDEHHTRRWQIKLF